jgi:hypothetical protein
MSLRLIRENAEENDAAVAVALLNQNRVLTENELLASHDAAGDSHGLVAAQDEIVQLRVTMVHQ